MYCKLLDLRLCIQINVLNVNTSWQRRNFIVGKYNFSITTVKFLEKIRKIRLSTEGKYGIRKPGDWILLKFLIFYKDTLIINIKRRNSHSHTVRKIYMARDGKYSHSRKIYRYYACKRSDRLFWFFFFQNTMELDWIKYCQSGWLCTRWGEIAQSLKFKNN